MKIDWKAIGKTVSSFLQRRSPEILTGIGIAGMGTTVVLTVTATRKATKKLANDGRDDLTRWETVKSVWKYYIPPAVTFGVSASCIIFASATNVHRNTALAAAYSVTETALRDYKEAAKELVGEKKEELLQDQANKRGLDSRHDIQEGKTYVLTGTQTVCYDPWSARDFPYDIDDLKHAIDELSYQLRDEEFVTLNEFYDLIGLERTYAGEILGWNAAGGPVRPAFSSTLVKDKPCLVLGFSRSPTETYR